MQGSAGMIPQGSGFHDYPNSLIIVNEAFNAIELEHKNPMHILPTKP